MEEAKKLEVQSFKNNIQNSEHIVLTQIMRSTIKSPKPSQSTGVFPTIFLFCNHARKRIKEKEQELSKGEPKKIERDITKYIE